MKCTCAKRFDKHVSEHAIDCALWDDDDRTYILDPEAFWQSLSPAAALALLRAAPKVAGPIQRTANTGAEYRDCAVVGNATLLGENLTRCHGAGWVVVDEEAK